MSDISFNRSNFLKVYNKNALLLGAFLGGPLVIGYIFAENFKALNKNELIRPVWIFTIPASIIIFGIVLLVPDSFNLPNYLIPLVYTIIAQLIFKKQQQEAIEKFINSGGQTYHWTHTLKVSLVGLILTLLIIALLSTQLTRPDDNYGYYKSYGIKMQHKIFFNPATISEKEVDSISIGLKRFCYLMDNNMRHIRVEKSSGLYVIYFPIDKNRANDSLVVNIYSVLRDKMDRFLPKNEIEFILIGDNLDDRLKVLKR